MTGVVTGITDAIAGMVSTAIDVVNDVKVAEDTTDEHVINILDGYNLKLEEFSRKLDQLVNVTQDISDRIPISSMKKKFRKTGRSRSRCRTRCRSRGVGPGVH